MTEAEVRRIVREEIAEWQADRDAVAKARADQFNKLMEDWRARENERNAPDPSDGPLTARVKACFRGEL